MDCFFDEEDQNDPCAASKKSCYDNPDCFKISSSQKNNLVECSKNLLCNQFFKCNIENEK